MHPLKAQTTELDSDSQIVIRAYREDDMERVRAILLAGGWQAQSADMIRFSELVARSQLALVAVRRGEVAGFVRALTDGISNGYISMLAVAPEYRGAGIGSSLVRACLGDNPDMTWVLRAGRPGLPDFYQKLGFQVSQVAMERPRQKLGAA